MSMVNLIFKSELSGDIRRFTLNDNISFEALHTVISKLYILPNRNFSISRTSGEPFSEDYFNKLVQDAKEKKTVGPIRIVVHKVDLDEVTTQNSDSTQNEENPKENSPIVADHLFQQVEFQQKLQTIIEEAIVSKPVLEVVMQQITPRVIQLVEETVSKSNTVQSDSPVAPIEGAESNEKVEVESNEEKLSESNEKKEVPSTINSSPSTSNIFESFIMEKIPQAINSTTSDLSKALENIFEKKGKEKVAEKLPEKMNEPKEKEVKEKEAPKQLITKEEPDQPDESQEDEGLSMKSVFTFFKSLKEKSYKTEQPNKKEVENLDEALRELNAMGFTDNEANIKALRFHKNFNEGLEAVVEDLLNQSSLQEKEKKETTENPQETQDQIVD